MANPFRNAMAFLGLVEEEEYEEHPAPQQRAQAAAPAPQPAPSRAAVTPIRRSAQQQKSADMNEILTVHPRAFRDVKTIAEHFREGVPVIINISQMAEPEARRLIDFSCGLAEALYGRMERVTGKVFLLSPSHVAVSGDQVDAADDVDASFFE
ncbi:MAG: cell division protein SepF [Micrococcales bacterium 73-13]|nr:MAG: cell division protein SepF [Micrococcales bacterium 73-13]